MNVFNKVTLQSLKKNKVRTIVTVIGIMLSAAMICAVTTFVSSMYNYAYENAVYNDGIWHGSEYCADFSVYERIINADEVDSAIYMQQLGYSKLENCKNEYKPYLYLLGASEKADEMLPIHITSGSYPVSQNEILIPEHLFENGGIKLNIGDTVELELGDRMFDGYRLWQHNPAYQIVQGEYILNEEEIAVRETRTYTIVGFYERPSFENYSAPGYTAITLADSVPYDDAQYEVYFTMKDPKVIYAFMDQNGFIGYTNSAVLAYSGSTVIGDFDSMVFSLAAIFIGLIMFGSVSLIYNAFSISVSERTKQFGLLSSVGATKKQLRRMVFFEAAAVSAIGIPLGIIVGIAGIGVTLMIIGNKFSALMRYSIPMSVDVSAESVVIAVIIALVTVLISAWIPSKRATRISAIDAIRQNRDIKAKPKKLRTGKLAYNLFGLPVMLASKQYKRSKKKYRATVISLFMSIVLFISASAFTDYLMISAETGLGESKYDMVMMCHYAEYEDMEALLNIFESDPNVTDAVYKRRFYTSGSVDAGCIDDKFRAIPENERYYDPSTGEWNIRNLILYFINDSAFEKLLDEYSLDRNEFMNPDSPKAIAFDENTDYDSEQKKYVASTILKNGECTVNAEKIKELDGYFYTNIVYDENSNMPFSVRYQSSSNSEDVLEIPYEDAIEIYSFRSGKTVHGQPYFKQDFGMYPLIFVYPDSLIDEVIGEQQASQMTYENFIIRSDDPEASHLSLKDKIQENGYYYTLSAEYEEEVENRNIMIIIKVFSYGFIVLISLIAAANVFNTISTNISLRRREFAMLKSVGMDSKGFNRMMNFECLLYGAKALIYGLPVSFGIAYLIHRAFSEGFEMRFTLPWNAVLIAVLSVFAVVFVTMMYSMSKIKKDNPIDALKNENL